MSTGFIVFSTRDIRMKEISTFGQTTISSGRKLINACPPLASIVCIQKTISSPASFIDRPYTVTMLGAALICETGPIGGVALPRLQRLVRITSPVLSDLRKVFASPPRRCVYNIVDDGHSRLRMQETVSHEYFDNKDGPILGRQDGSHTGKVSGI